MCKPGAKPTVIYYSIYMIYSFHLLKTVYNGPKTNCKTWKCINFIAQKKKMAENKCCFYIIKQFIVKYLAWCVYVFFLKINAIYTFIINQSLLIRFFHILQWNSYMPLSLTCPYTFWGHCISHTHAHIKQIHKTCLMRSTLSKQSQPHLERQLTNM